MNSRISKKDIKLLLYVGGLLLLALAYFLGYQKFMEKREVLEAEQANLQQQVNRLNEIAMYLDDYEEQAAVYDEEMDKIFSDYPAEVREEDTILYACDMENSYDIWVSNIGISPANQVFSLGDNVTTDVVAAETTTDESAAAGTESTGMSVDEQLGIQDEATVTLPYISLFDTAVVYDFTTGYSDCKSVFAMILACADKRNVSSISLAYDTETGLLNGNMNVNMFYMTGSDKTYEEPDAGIIVHGKDNLFGTVEVQGE